MNIFHKNKEAILLLVKLKIPTFHRLNQLLYLIQINNKDPQRKA